MAQPLAKYLRQDGEEPLDRNEPLDPLDRNEPLDPLDQNEPLDPLDRNEPLDRKDIVSTTIWVYVIHFEIFLNL